MDKKVEKHANKPRGEMRQTKYAVTDEKWIKNLVNTGAYAVLATSHFEQPFATPLTYAYIEEDHAIYFHGAKSGRLRANMTINPKVCVNIARFGRMVPAEEAIQFSMEYESVTLFGTAELVQDEQQKLKALQALMDKYFPDKKPGKDYPPLKTEDAESTGIYKINIQEWTGKLHPATDRPDAFTFPNEFQG
jgi:nitroimidazol reductase NimA-like FMN-containing flavoprotein (pyridoxamine 5'-phosphate oxidase superfamily)